MFELPPIQKKTPTKMLQHFSGEGAEELSCAKKVDRVLGVVEPAHPSEKNMRCVSRQNGVRLKFSQINRGEHEKIMFELPPPKANFGTMIIFDGSEIPRKNHLTWC